MGGEGRKHEYSSVGEDGRVVARARSTRQRPGVSRRGLDVVGAVAAVLTAGGC